MEIKPEIGLALGSGASRGLAHLGVLLALEKERIPINMISGSSIGALLGCLYASGISVDMMIKLAKHLDSKQFMDFAVPRKGFIKGNKIVEMIRLLTKGKNLEDLNIPTCVIATDLRKAQRYIFEKGPIWKAVRASISIPGIFTPVEYEDMILVDGGVVDRVPTVALRQMGADFIIAVDVGVSVLPFSKTDTIFDVIIQTIDVMEREIVKHRIVDADVLICPDVHEINPANFNQVEICVEKGIEAANLAMNEIREKIKILYNNCANQQ